MTLEIVPLLRSTPMVDSKWWRISRAVIPPAYKPMIIASSPSILRWPLRTRRGVNEPARSRGAPRVSKGPTSESMVLVVVPLRALPRAEVVGSPFS